MPLSACKRYTHRGPAEGDPPHMCLIPDGDAKAAASRRVASPPHDLSQGAVGLDG